MLHFSEDPTIELFVPHVAATAAEPEPYVWAVDRHHAPSYWFPRQCPRAMAWVVPETSDADRGRIIGAGCGTRVNAIEFGWLPAMRSTMLYAYRLPADKFHAVGKWQHAHVATEPITPLAPPSPVGDLVECHARAGIQLRLLDNLWSFWDEVIASSAGFSGIRLRNAAPRRPG